MHEAPKDNSGKVAVVLVAAGRGERAGQPEEGPKQYRPIGGRPVLRHTLEAFTGHPRIGTVAVAIHPDDEALFRQAAAGLQGDIISVPGGASRQASTLAALQALRPMNPHIVLIHDGVRPFVDVDMINGVIDAVEADGGALPALAVADTLKRVNGAGMIEETVARNGLFAAQTPQGFAFRTILEAHEKAFAEGRDGFTDDAAIAEWAGIAVRIVGGSQENVKLTWAHDIERADRRVSGGGMRFPDIRTGNGYDVHSFTEGKSVTLCGVEIPHEKRLSGHSDADVGLHALTDALLATCGAGDIGTHFPPSDPQWKGAASRIFVEHAAGIVRARGGRIANADVTLICEAPRIGGHRDSMREAMAKMLGITVGRVSVKATTNEKLGFVGREEGIAAIATATVAFPGELPE